MVLFNQIHFLSKITLVYMFIWKHLENNLENNFKVC